MGIFDAADAAQAMDDKDIASGMGIDSTSSIGGLSTIVASTSNPDLKRIFEGYLEQAVVAQTAIGAYLTEKGWAKPFASPDEQMTMALRDCEGIVSRRC